MQVIFMELVSSCDRCVLPSVYTHKRPSMACRDKQGAIAMSFGVLNAKGFGIILLPHWVSRWELPFTDLLFMTVPLARACFKLQWGE